MKQSKMIDKMCDIIEACRAEYGLGNPRFGLECSKMLLDMQKECGMLPPKRQYHLTKNEALEWNLRCGDDVFSEGDFVSEYNWDNE